MGVIKVLLLTAIVAVLSLVTVASSLPTEGIAEVGLPDDTADERVVDLNEPTVVDDDEPEEDAQAMSRSTSADRPGLARILRRRKVCRYPRCGLARTRVIARIEYPCFFKRSRKVFIASAATCGRKPYACKTSACRRWKECKCTEDGGLGKRMARLGGAVWGRCLCARVSPVARVMCRDGRKRG